MRVLSINCGSSTLKYATFDVESSDERQTARGTVERIGQAIPDHATAVHALLEDLERSGLLPDAVGHRVVHGGALHAAPVVVDDALLTELDGLAPFAPLHLPAEIRAIRAVADRWPNRRQVACFDTAFHRTLSDVAQRYAVPESVHAAGARRYGFHGLSYEYVVGSVGAQTLGRAVVAQLGSGASMAAIRESKSVDKTMGFTPSGGLVMATRLGDVDPGLLLYLAQHGYDARALEQLVNQRAGLLGLSGTSADVRDLLARSDSDPRARLALDVFVWSARRWVGAMTASLGGIDTLVFTGGIGQHAPPVRADIARGLEYLGVHLDDERNRRGDAVVSPDGSPCVVRIVETDEERMVARHAARLSLEPGVQAG